MADHTLVIQDALVATRSEFSAVEPDGASVGVAADNVALDVPLSVSSCSVAVQAEIAALVFQLTIQSATIQPRAPAATVREDVTLAIAGCSVEVGADEVEL